MGRSSPVTDGATVDRAGCHALLYEILDLVEERRRRSRSLRSRTARSATPSTVVPSDTDLAAARRELTRLGLCRPLAGPR